MAGLLTDRRDTILVVTINRPESRNAINLEVARGIADAMDVLDGEETLRAAVLTGAGGYFSAGMDLKAFARSGERPHVEGRGFAGLVQQPPRKPLIAAIEGFALAGGLEIALACDMIVAARGAKLGIPEVQRGLVAASGGLLRLPDFVPRPIAMYLALTGEAMPAEQAERYGLVNRVVDPGAALDAALAIAARLSANAPLALAASKEILDQAASARVADGWHRQGALVDRVLTSEDAREGARAFVEKRAPRWAGR